jgi:hypothetical protein
MVGSSYSQSKKECLGVVPERGRQPRQRKGLILLVVRKGNTPDAKDDGVFCTHERHDYHSGADAMAGDERHLRVEERVDTPGRTQRQHAGCERRRCLLHRPMVFDLLSASRSPINLDFHRIAALLFFAEELK